jgi:hypothetical protein
MGRAKRRAFCVVLAACLLFIAAAPSAADYGPTVVAGTSSNAERKLASAPNGTLFATYTVPEGNSTRIAVKQSGDGGATWAFLPQLGTAEAFRSCVAVDGEGVLHVAWTEFVGPDRQVFYASWAGGPNWTHLQRVSDTPGYSGFPSLGLDEHNQVHIVWYGYDGTHYQIYYRFRDRQGWQPTVQATHGAQDANNPAVAVDQNATAYVAFFSVVARSTDVWFLQTVPGGWSALERVNPAGVSAHDPSIALTGSAVAVAYSAELSGSAEVRYTERGPAGNWSTAVAVSDLAEGGDHPSLVSDGQGNVAVLYENAAGAIRLRARVNGEWGSPSSLSSSGQGRWVSAAFVPWGSGTAGGNVTALWTEGGAGAPTVAFGKAAPFPAPASCKCGPNPLMEWAVPLLIVLVAGAAALGLAIASARTKGGGRG